MFIQDVDYTKIKNSKTIFLSPYLTSEGKTQYCLISQNFHLVLSSLEDGDFKVHNFINNAKKSLSCIDIINHYHLQKYKTIIVLPFRSKQNLTALQLHLDLSSCGNNNLLPFLKKEKLTKEDNNKVIFEKTFLFQVPKENADFFEISNYNSNFSDFYKDKAVFFPISGLDLSFINIPTTRIIDHQYLKYFYNFNEKKERSSDFWAQIIFSSGLFTIITAITLIIIFKNKPTHPKRCRCLETL